MTTEGIQALQHILDNVLLLKPEDCIRNCLELDEIESRNDLLSLFDDDVLFSLIVSGKVKVLSALLLFDSSVCCLKSTYTLSVFKPSEGVSQFRITGAVPNPPIP